MKQLTARQIQLEELEILKNFILFCKKNKLQYFLYGGTALGAVRHRGFIPWDDDIDIIMPKPDYERFKSLINNGNIISTNYKIYIPEQEKKPKTLICKIYNTEIHVEATNEIDTGYLWIDIMQLNGLPKRPNLFLKKILFLRRLYLAKMKQIYHYSYKTNSFAKNLIRKILLSLINYEFLMKLFFRQCNKYSYENSTYVTNIPWYNTPKKIFQKKWFDHVKTIQFEDIQPNIMNDYDHFLKQRYGNNYMEIPDKKHRETHSFIAWRQ